MKKIILSRGRSETINTHNLINDFTLLVPKSELNEYSKKVDKERIVTIPDEIVELACVRNWVMDSFDGDLLMLDDDIKSFYFMTREKAEKIKTKQTVDDFLNIVYENAKELGVKLWSINQTPDVRKYKHNEPFSLSGWVGSVVGIIGRDYRFDEKNKLRVDVDYSLQNLLKDRIVWKDNRIAFFSDKDNNIGGNAKCRSQENLKKEKEYLKNKWGKYIQFSDNKTKDQVRLNVERKSKIVLN